MRDVKAWAVSFCVHGVVAALFLVSFSCDEPLKKDNGTKEHKLQIESVFIAAKNDIAVENPSVKAQPRQTKEAKTQKKEVKEQENILENSKQSTPTQQTATQEHKKEESVAAATQAPKKPSYSEVDKKQFLASVKQAITKHIIYPDAARRRSLEGEVGVRFVLMANGTLGQIKIDSGNSVFHRAAINAIESTKVTPPTSIQLPLELTLTLFFELDKQS